MSMSILDLNGGRSGCLRLVCCFQRKCDRIEPSDSLPPFLSMSGPGSSTAGGRRGRVTQGDVMRVLVLASTLGLAALSGCAATDSAQARGSTEPSRTIEWKDVPAGRGQTRRIPFWVPATTAGTDRTREPVASPAQSVAEEQQTERSSIEWRDAPRGHGQTQTIPFWLPHGR